MAYGYFKDLARKKASDKILHYKEFNIAENQKYDEYQKVLASMVRKFLDKKSSGSSIRNENMSDQQLTEELHKPIIRIFLKRKVQLSFMYNICGTDLADMILIINK